MKNSLLVIFDETPSTTAQECKHVQYMYSLLASYRFQGRNY